MRMFRTHRTGGFSLLEILVAMGIFALFTLTLTRIMMGGMQTFRRGQAISAIRSDLRTALDLITAEFRQSTSAVTSPSYPSANAKTLTLTFRRSTLSGSTVTETPITYAIDAATNRLTRTDLDTLQRVLVAENILTGQRLGESQGADLSPSYFYWAVNPSVTSDPLQANHDSATLEIRLTGLKFEGQQQQRMSMVTQVSQRFPFDLTATNANAKLNPKVSLAIPADLGRPGGLFFLGR